MAGEISWALDALTRISALTHGTTAASVPGKTRGAVHATRGGRTVIADGCAVDLGGVGSTRTDNFHAVFVHAPTFRAGYVVGTLDGLKVTHATAFGNANRMAGIVIAKCLGTSRLNSTQVLAGG